jgi:hypothetical protein
MGLLAAAGCAGANPGAWQKPGADQQTIARDGVECRGAARDEAQRRYPYRIDIPGAGAAGAVASYQQDDANRTTIETVQFNDCMLARGYTRG